MPLLGGVVRRYIIGLGALFPVPAHPVFIGGKGHLSCVLVGLLAGALSALLTVSVYSAEDFVGKLPIHWMWWLDPDSAPPFRLRNHRQLPCSPPRKAPAITIDNREK
jgi:hypothetical protein